MFIFVSLSLYIHVQKRYIIIREKKVYNQNLITVLALFINDPIIRLPFGCLPEGIMLDHTLPIYQSH